MALITPIYTPDSVIEYGAEVAWIEAAYNGQLQTPDGTGNYLPRVQTLPLGSASLTQASFESLPNTGVPSAVQAAVGSIASSAGLTVTPTKDATNLDLSSITLGTPVDVNSAQQIGGTVTVDNTRGTTPISNTYTIGTTYQQTVLDEHTSGWSNTTTVMIGNTFAPGFFNKFSSSLTNSYSWNGSARTGTDTTTSVTRTDMTAVNVPPGKKTLVEVLYSEVTQDYPYTATLENTSGLETVQIEGTLPSGQSGTYEVFANDAVNYAKQFLAPNSELLGNDNGTPTFIINGTFTGVNGADFTITQQDITPVGTPAPVPEPGFVPGSVVGLVLMMWRKLIKR